MLNRPDFNREIDNIEAIEAPYNRTGRPRRNHLILNFAEDVIAASVGGFLGDVLTTYATGHIINFEKILLSPLDWPWLIGGTVGVIALSAGKHFFGKARRQ